MDNHDKPGNNIGYKRRGQTKQKHNTICVVHHYTQRNTNNVNKTWVLQIAGGKDEPNIVFMRKSWRTSQHGTKKTRGSPESVAHLVILTCQFGLSKVVVSNKKKNFIGFLIYTKNEIFARDQEMSIHAQFVLTQIILFFHYPMWFYAKILFYGGNHLAFFNMA